MFTFLQLKWHHDSTDMKVDKKFHSHWCLWWCYRIPRYKLPFGPWSSAANIDSLCRQLATSDNTRVCTQRSPDGVGDLERWHLIHCCVGLAKLRVLYAGFLLVREQREFLRQGVLQLWVSDREPFVVTLQLHSGLLKQLGGVMPEEQRQPYIASKEISKKDLINFDLNR